MKRFEDKLTCDGFPFTPAKKAKNNLVRGVGVNDAPYEVRVYREDGARWNCPYYLTWAGLLERCYSPKALNVRENYRDVTVCEEWLYFMKFRAWMVEQDWEGKQLDKDLLIQGNTVYSPETCIFTTGRINSLFLDCSKARGEFPLGVHFSTERQKFVGGCRDGSGKRLFLGRFESPSEAHRAWQKAKLGVILSVMNGCGEDVVTKALKARVHQLELDISLGKITVKL